jgi:hypothetical protein
MSFISDIFGGGGSTSSTSATTTTQQQVGAEGNLGPTFGAITTHGGAVTTKNTAKAKTKATATTTAKATKGAKKAASTAPVSASESAATAGQTASGGGGSGNVNISTTTTDPETIAMLQQVAEGSIAAQNELAQGALNLATTTLQTGTDLAALGITAGAQAGTAAQAAAAPVAETVAQPISSTLAAEPVVVQLPAEQNTPSIEGTPTAAAKTNWTPYVIAGAIGLAAVAAVVWFTHKG